MPSKSNKSTNSENLSPSVNTSTLEGIHDALKQINCRLDRYDKLTTEVSDLKADIWEQEGILQQLKSVAADTDHNSADIESPKVENKSLRDELNLVRSVVIKMDKNITNMESELTDLRSRSMRDNILVHNFAYSDGENLLHDVPAKIKEHLGVDVKFIRIHRNGVRREGYRRPATITGKLEDRNLKDVLLRAQKDARNNGKQVPFFITAHEPISITENRKKMYEISDNLKKNAQTNAKVSKGKIMLPNGHEYVEEVSPLQNCDVLSSNAELLDQIKDTEVVTPPLMQKDGNTFIAEASIVKSVTEVNNLHWKVRCGRSTASADHHILVYRFKDERGKIHQSYHDDWEYGAGRRLLKYMINMINNCAVVICRWKGNRFLGYDRFSIMEELVCMSADELYSE